MPTVVRKIIRVAFYFSFLCPVLLSLFCAVASFRAPPMIVSDVVTKVFDKEKFPQHTIVDLKYGITFIVLFSQEKLSR